MWREYLREQTRIKEKNGLNVKNRKKEKCMRVNTCVCICLLYMYMHKRKTEGTFTFENGATM